MPYIFFIIIYANVIFFLILERLGHMQFRIKIVFLKERFFLFFNKREPIRLIPKIYLTCKSQFEILNV